MTREEAAMKLSLHLMQCGMLMPIEWVENNGEGSETSEAFQMAIAALREQEEQSNGCDWCDFFFDHSGKFRFCPQCGRRLEEV